MPRARALAAGVIPLLLAACRSDTVSVAYAPEIGDSYEYRYDIEATVTRTVEGEEPNVVEVDTVLLAEQDVQAQSRTGTRIRLELIREGGVARTAVVLVDRAGSLEGVELVDDLDAAVFGVADAGSLVPTNLGAPPDRPLAPGDRWTVSDVPLASTSTSAGSSARARATTSATTGRHAAAAGCSPRTPSRRHSIP